MTKQILCDVSWGTHACMLPEDHLGDCVCMDLVYEHPWIWMDTGGWCNWWDGREIGFLNQVCSCRNEWTRGYRQWSESDNLDIRDQRGMGDT